MPVGGRIERSGIYGFNALHGALGQSKVNERRIVCGGWRRWQSVGDGAPGVPARPLRTRRARGPPLHRLISPTPGADECVRPYVSLTTVSQAPHTPPPPPG